MGFEALCEARTSAAMLSGCYSRVMGVVDLSEVRRKAWETRRAKYGESGHGRRAYRTTAAGKATVDAALDELSRARKALRFILHEDKAHEAITHIDLAVDTLAPGMWVNSATLGWPAVPQRDDVLPDDGSG